MAFSFFGGGVFDCKTDRAREHDGYFREKSRKGDWIMGDFSKEVQFEIVKHIGVITTHSTGWRKEVNIVSWNRGKPKIDIRDWSPDHEHMSRGVTFTESEFRKVMDLVRQDRQEKHAMSKPKDMGYER